jgi:hypothetical protein
MSNNFTFQKNSFNIINKICYIIKLNFIYFNINLKLNLFFIKEKFKREFYKRFTILQKFGYGKRFTRSAYGLTTGATTLSEYHHEKIGSSNINNKTYIVKDRCNSSSQMKKSCCVQNENMLSGNGNNKTSSSYLRSSHAACNNNDNIELHPFIEKCKKQYHNENNED